MSSSSIGEAGVEPAAEAPAEAAPAQGAAGTFAGDTGTLPLETRRALVQLLLGPSIDATRHRRLWPVLRRDEAVLRSRLHELFLDLVIDHEQEVAFTRQVVAEDIDAPILLRRSHLTFLETALVLYLRQQLTRGEAAGERAVVSAGDMQGHLAVFERIANPDRARFGRQVDGAIEKAKKLSLLRLLPGSASAGEQRFEVAPTLKLLFPAESIQALATTYEALLAGGGRAADAAAGDAATGDDDDDAGVAP